MTATHTPRQTLGAWSDIDLATREHLAAQTPHRLQRVMYGANVWDADPGHFIPAVAEADARLRDLCAERPDAARLFGDLTFASVASEPDTMLAAEREYYLCDALIDYAARHFGHIWTDFPVLDRKWLGMFHDTET
ncbi:hypothetical protein ABZ353_31855 [Streptomyces niveus]|uniref:hypothetical protein n=1 Tax=Streptomyces niveus TaxID=193462 RepID=UPI0034082D57